MNVRCTAVALLAAVALFQPAAAADYPTRAVSFVVPYAAGGATDQLARLLGRHLESKFGQSFVIENRPGASSAIGAAYVSKAAPDGYTILMATSTTMAINVSVFKKLAYQPLVDLTPVALIANSPFVLVVNNDLPVRSVADLVTLARSKPGELTYASSGPGSAHHLDMQLLASMAGLKLTHVVYKGSLPALNDVIAGHVKMMFSDMSAALPLIGAGKVRALGVSTATRVSGAPHLPTVAESGLPGYDAAAWQMVVMPAKTPDPTVDELHLGLREFQATDRFKSTVSKWGLDPLVTPPRPELVRFVESEIVRWRRVVSDAGLAAVP
ncbi:MAG: tripartite tricarboxylate transporter substrate binding protein [Hyphomicrobiales bacterium]|nr:tripartite tricarboxylate transporter substrate binding protein [Hyphomicrobiales bacterium]